MERMECADEFHDSRIITIFSQTSLPDIASLTGTRHSVRSAGRNGAANPHKGQQRVCTKVGVIGLGNMGGGIARNFNKARAQSGRENPGGAMR